ncbi:translation initiation factor IF-2 N-terminal domain-containing protein [Nocardia sp. 348MFTsu5.1]|uniref:translation initiation factor IF-2 N-terminal domain-containing protein n=1 Tax=Nocardia sp. 348MFTsu5.1 TaxID=1172185 RepID=UPI000372C66F|nr:translation initiation factor IF-2 N-terminal domain-containing protein [Nocardia sp. 348MFTsu5.1]
MADTQSPDDLNHSGSAHEFPHKMRVHALARILGLSSREVLAHLADMGITARSPQSSIVRSTAIAVRDKIAAEAEPADSEASAEPSEPAETAEAPAPTADQQAPAAEPEIPVAEPEAVAAEPEAEAPEAEAPTAVEPTDVEPSPDEAPVRAPRVRRKKTAETFNLFSAAEEEAPLAVERPASTEHAGSPLFLSAEPVAPVHADQESDDSDSDTDTDSDDDGDGGSRRRRRGRRGRGRGRGEAASADGTDEDTSVDADTRESDSQDAQESDTQASSTADSDDEQTDKTEVKSNNRRKRSRSKKPRTDADADLTSDASDDGDVTGEKADSSTDDAEAAEDTTAGDSKGSADADADDSDESGDEAGSANRRRRRRRRRKGGESDDATTTDDPPNTVVHEREPRNKSRVRDEVQGISGSTRLEAKRQRRRDGRDAGRRRPPILSESEFLARRESVDRVMVVRERSGVAATVTHEAHGDNSPSDAPQATRDYTQVAVLEDGVLVEHFVTTSNSSSMVGNIYLGRVQNVLPGMEAAFVDIGRGRNGVLYAGEVNWDAAGLDGGSRKIEQALRPGDPVLVQVSKDPVGHKGARLTTQISLAGRYLVYVPGGGSTGISRKLPDTERKRLKQILGKIVPDDAGVIIRTASEGVAAEELTRDIERLQQQWETISAATPAAGKSKSTAPQALYEEPDLLVKVVRDLFNEDFKKLIVEGNGAWDQVESYVRGVAPDLLDRVERFDKAHADAPDVFDVHRIDEQLAKALDRKVWLPSGGTLIIEHTEAMTVVDVNTGKFTGSGGNLEETVTRNNLEAAEEIVRQMRLRDIGGMIIVDFIDMVLESNRDLVLRRLTEALGRDRTRHQVSEVTSLGLVQMTRKRLGTGLLEAFSTTCTCCSGRGIVVHANPVEISAGGDDSNRGGSDSKRPRRNRRGGKTDQPAAAQVVESKPAPHSPAEHPMFRAMASHTTDSDGETHHAEAHGTEQHDAEPDSAAATTPSTAAVESPVREDVAVVAEPQRQAPVIEPEPQPESVVAAADKVDEPSVTDVTIVPAVAEDVSTSEPAQAPTGHPTPPKRRRAVRRKPTASSAPSQPAVVVEVTPAAPVTTSGPVGATTEPVVAVRRKPRRRAAGRPAGPPVEE